MNCTVTDFYGSLLILKQNFIGKERVSKGCFVEIVDNKLLGKGCRTEDSWEPHRAEMILHCWNNNLPNICFAKFHFLDSILTACGVMGIRERIFSNLKVLIFPTVPILPLFSYKQILLWEQMCCLHSVHWRGHTPVYMWAEHPSSCRWCAAHHPLLSCCPTLSFSGQCGIHTDQWRSKNRSKSA